MTGLIAADFDGNGTADILQIVPVITNSLIVAYELRVSLDGRGDWKTINILNMPSLEIAGIGKFDEMNGTDILIWNKSFLEAVSGASRPPARQSRQDMR